MIARACATLVATLALTGVAVAEPTYTFLKFDDLDGWAADDHTAALDAFVRTCGDVPRTDFKRLCAYAKDGPAARDFFETFFQPVLIEDGAPMLFTGYYEPEIKGDVAKSDAYPHPIYRLPPDLVAGRAFLTRREIEETGALSGLGLEIAWLHDPVDLFFLQVQGSGRIRLPDGDVIRVGYAGKNGRDYSSVGMKLVARGIYSQHQVSADVIRNWVRDNPEEGQKLLWENDSYVFFREVNEVPPEAGPLGAMNRSITTLRSIAVDPAVTILGAPVWIEKDGVDPMRRLMIAQDTGSAIKGAQRADIFYGTGTAAGRKAGTIKDGGRMVVLMPVEYALSKVEDPLR